MQNHFVLLLLLTSTVFAQSRFDGTWKMKMETLQFFSAPEEYLLEKGMYTCLTCVPRVDVNADGSSQRVTGHPYFDSIVVRVVSATSVEFTQKKEGKLMFSCTETVSSDGQTMTEDFANTMEAEVVRGKADFHRVSAGPPGSHALSGKWSMRTVRNATSAGTLTTYHSTAHGMRISDGSQSYTVRLDGKDYPVDADRHSTVSLKLIDEYTMEETDKRDGNIMTVARMMVSRDGKSMRVESSDKQRGGTMTYTAEKRP